MYTHRRLRLPPTCSPRGVHLGRCFSVNQRFPPLIPTRESILGSSVSAHRYALSIATSLHHRKYGVFLDLITGHFVEDSRLLSIIAKGGTVEGKRWEAYLEINGFPTRQFGLLVQRLLCEMWKSQRNNFISVDYNKFVYFG